MTHLLAPLLPALLATLPQDPVPTQETPPAEARGLVAHEPGAFPGYTLISPLLSKDVHLLDMEGEVVHTWHTELAPAGSVYLLDDGSLLRAGRVEDNPRFRGGGAGGRVQLFSWEGELSWDYLLADDFLTQHHDLQPLPNGNVLAIVWEHRFEEDALEWGRDQGAIGETGLWPDALLEIRPLPPDDGEVVWEWHAWDHLIQDRDPEKPGYGDVAARPERIDINAEHRDRPAVSAEEQAELAKLEEEMRALGYVGGDEDDEGDEGDSGPSDRRSTAPDWMHVNGVDYHPELDLIVFSSPTLCEIFVIDHSTTTEEAAFGDGGRWDRGGDLLWRWGNPRNHGAGGDSDRRLFYQHDSRFVPGATPDELRVLVFNNGQGRDYSTVEELVLPFDPERGFESTPGKPHGPAAPAWSYGGPGGFFASFISGAQRLPNGNTLICEGPAGRLFEVTRDKEIVWEYLNPHGGETAPNAGGGAPPKALFRGTRIALDHPSVAGRL